MHVNLIIHRRDAEDAENAQRKTEIRALAHSVVYLWLRTMMKGTVLTCQRQNLATFCILHQRDILRMMDDDDN